MMYWSPAGQVSLFDTTLYISPTRALLSAIIKITVTFEVFPFQYFHTERREIVFTAKKAPNGNWFWLPHPIGKPDK
jgi:hypothetical protein